MADDAHSKFQILGRRNLPENIQEFKTKFEKNIKIALSHTSEIQKEDKIALGFSGGQSSRCLLYVLDTLLSDRSFKKTESSEIQKYFEMEIIHVDVSSLNCLQITAEKSLEIRKKIEEIIKSQKNQYKLHFVPLESLWLENNNSDKNLESAKQLMNQFIDQFEDISSKERIIADLIENALILTAEKLNVQKLVLGDSANRISIKILSGMGMQKGSALTLDTLGSVKLPKKILEIGEKSNDLTLLRPMRGSLAKEIALYCFLSGFDNVFVPTLSSFVVPRMSGKQGSMDALCERFISMMQSKFPSTVHTLLRTFEKVAVEEGMEIKNNEHFKNGEKYVCAMCQSILNEEEIEECFAIPEEELEKISEKHQIFPHIHEFKSKPINSELSEKNLPFCAACRSIFENQKKRIEISKFPSHTKEILDQFCLKDENGNIIE